MTRYIVEYRRLSAWHGEWGDWTIYFQGADKELAMDAYCRHVSNYPNEQVRLAVYSFEPEEVIYSFAPHTAEEEEAA